MEGQSIVGAFEEGSGAKVDLEARLVVLVCAADVGRVHIMGALVAGMLAEGFVEPVLQTSFAECVTAVWEAGDSPHVCVSCWAAAGVDRDLHVRRPEPKCAYIAGRMIFELASVLMRMQIVNHGREKGASGGKTHKLVFLFFSQRATFILKLCILLVGIVSAYKHVGDEKPNLLQHMDLSPEFRYGAGT